MGLGTVLVSLITAVATGFLTFDHGQHQLFIVAHVLLSPPPPLSLLSHFSVSPLLSLSSLCLSRDQSIYLCVRASGQLNPKPKTLLILLFLWLLWMWLLVCAYGSVLLVCHAVPGPMLVSCLCLCLGLAQVAAPVPVSCARCVLVFLSLHVCVACSPLILALVFCTKLQPASSARHHANRVREIVVVVVCVCVCVCVCARARVRAGVCERECV